MDLGAPATFDRVRLSWEAAAGRKYRIETSPDGLTWTPVATYPVPALRSTGGRLDVDGRAGIVVSGPNPITVAGDRVTLSDGPAAPLLAELYPGPVGARPSGRVTTTSPAVQASVTDGFLVLVNLSGTAVRGTAALPGETRLYRGEQILTRSGTELSYALAPAEGRIEPPRFTVRGPTGLKAVVRDASRVELTAPAGVLPVLVTVTPDGGRARSVLLLPGRTVPVVFAGLRPYPLADRALGRVTFPADLLPPGMSSPATAVDDDPATAWQPGPDGRMVVDLGAVTEVSAVELAWTRGHVPGTTVETSLDGVTYATARTGPARYVPVRTRWKPGDASLTRLSVRT